ncbi:hypothetical protein [Pararhodobacter sp.]
MDMVPDFLMNRVGSFDTGSYWQLSVGLATKKSSATIGADVGKTRITQKMGAVVAPLPKA